MLMHLRLLLPTAVLLDARVGRITADGQHGSFTLLPRHVDFVAALVPGLLSWEVPGGPEAFGAVDGGVLVKRGRDVAVATRRAVVGAGLGELRRAIEVDFQTLDERERQARSAMARLEVDFVQRFLELGQGVRG
jgi:F-type H+-transporting ATPase subunit epsilon